MSTHAGVLRDRVGLEAAAAGLAELGSCASAAPATENWETTNLLIVASALVQAAAIREETRGSHWRDDFAERDDAHWLGNLDTVQTPDGTLLTDFAPLGVAAGGREQRAAGQSRAGQPG